MTEMSIPKALGLLQEDPDNEAIWAELKAALGYVSPFSPLTGAAGDRLELGKLLYAAREAHAQRGESEAAAELLRIRLAVFSGTPDEMPAAEELAKVLEEEIFDDQGAASVYERILQLNPSDMKAEDELEKFKAKRAKWRELVARYVKEAKAANEASFRSSLLVSAAEAAFRFASAFRHPAVAVVKHQTLCGAAAGLALVLWGPAGVGRGIVKSSDLVEVPAGAVKAGHRTAGRPFGRSRRQKARNAESSSLQASRRRGPPGLLAGEPGVGVTVP